MRFRGITVMPGARARFLFGVVGAVSVAALIAGCSATSQSAPTTPTGRTATSTGAAPATTTTTGPTTTTAPTTAAPATPPTPVPASLSMRPVKGANGVDPTAPVVVTAGHGVLSSLAVTNPAGEQVTGRYSADRSTWTSTEDLGYGKTYDVVAVATGKIGAPARANSSFTTVQPRTLTYPSIFPGPGITDVGVGQPIDVTFDESITDKAAAEKALVVTTSPPQLGAWHWMSDRDVQWRPKDYWRPATKVTLNADVYGKDLGNGVFGQEDRTVSFKIHDDWRVIGSVANHTLTVYHNGAAVRTVPASFGKTSTPTHGGVHVIYQKFHLYLMNSCSYGICSGPSAYTNFHAYYAQRISGDGEFLHVNESTVYDQGRYNVSHGCINVSMAQGIWLYQHLDIGDIVDVQGGTPQLGIDDGYGAWNASWSQWLAGSALHQPTT